MANASEKKLSAGFLLFVGVVLAACGVLFRRFVMDDRAGETRSWMSSHAWLVMLVAGVLLVAFAIMRMVRPKNAE